MIPLDHGDGAARPQQPLESDQRFDRLRQVLQHEAYEDVVERAGLEGQLEDVGLHEFDVGEPTPGDRLPRLVDGLGDTSIDTIRASGLLRASVTVCAPTPHPASSTRLSRG